HVEPPQCLRGRILWRGPGGGMSQLTHFAAEDIGTNVPGRCLDGSLADQSLRSGEHDRLGSGVHVELTEDARQVVSYGLLADEDARCDLGIAEPAREVAKNIDLALGELLEVRMARRVRIPLTLREESAARLTKAGPGGL